MTFVRRADILLCCYVYWLCSENGMVDMIKFELGCCHQ